MTYPSLSSNSSIVKLQIVVLKDHVILFQSVFFLFYATYCLKHIDLNLMDRNSNRYAIYICPLKDGVRILKMSSSQSSVIVLSQNHTTCVLAPYTNSVTQLLPKIFTRKQNTG